MDRLRDCVVESAESTCRMALHPPHRPRCCRTLISNKSMIPRSSLDGARNLLKRCCARRPAGQSANSNRRGGKMKRTTLGLLALAAYGFAASAFAGDDIITPIVLPEPG